MSEFVSRRAQAVPGSVFGLMYRAAQEARAAGHQVIDLSLGSLDLPPPPQALAALHRAVDDPSTYPYGVETKFFRVEAANWLERRFGAQISPAAIQPLLGAQEGLAHLLLAVADPGDYLLLPAACYPAYWGAAAVAGLQTYPLALDQEGRAILEAPSEVLNRAKVLLLNYPANPTGALADPVYLNQALDFARQHNLLLVHDNPYAELIFAGSPLAALALPGATEQTVELFSFSKGHRMMGFRIGFAAGNLSAIQALETVKGPIDFNPYGGFLQMGVAALNTPLAWVEAGAATLRERAAAAATALNSAGIPASLPGGSMYLWFPAPGGDDLEFALRAAKQAGVVLSPGRGFGPGGVGFLRLALVAPTEVLLEACERLGHLI